MKVSTTARTPPIIQVKAFKITSMKTYIYPTVESNYLKVCETPDSPNSKNKAAIIRGVLNLKSPLIKQLRKRGCEEVFKALQGPTESGHGRGYVGYKTFKSDDAAIVWLCKYLARVGDVFDVRR
jgi:hypothetical protein